MSDIKEEGTVSAAENQSGIVSHRAAKMAVIILGALIVIALGLVVFGIARNMSGSSISAATVATEKPAILTLGPGATIKRMDVQDNRVVLQVQTEAGIEVDIIDIETGRLIAKIRPAPQNP
ncbi:MAG TPA: hypothetical protein VFI93_07660 [Rhizomicrobium sp.]|nr:hypothetical protein [Rhizomicrobium sp.]